MALRKNTLTIIIGILTSGFFGYLSIRSFNWEVLRQVLWTIKPLPFLISCSLWVVDFILRAYRWKFFLPPDKQGSFGSRFSGIVVGYMFNMILPMRAGDLIRPAYLVKVNHISYKVGFYSLLIERIYEIVILIIWVLILFNLLTISKIEVLSIDLSLLFISALAGVIFLLYTRRILVSLQKLLFRIKLASLSGKVGDIIEAFEVNLKFSLKRTIVLILLTVAIIFVNGLIYLLIIDSLSIDIPFLGNFLVMFVSAISFLLPSAPASVGVFHYFCHLGLIAFGTDSTVAMSGAIVIHATFAIIDILVGVLGLIFGPLKLSHLRGDLKSQPERIHNLE